MSSLNQKRVTPSSSDLLGEIIETGSITPLFQPIYDLKSACVIGHEALSRGPEGSFLHMPDKLFQAAVATNRLHELEILCRSKALEQFSSQALPGRLFLNVSASLLSSADHHKGMTLKILNELAIPRDRIVIELSEQHPYDHLELTRASVDYYRRMGFQVAIDDLGAGYSGLTLWSELQPECVKIDKHFTRDIDSTPVKQEFVRSICSIAKSLCCYVIAEGIETSAELDKLMELGVTKGQGFLLGRPVERPNIVRSDIVIERLRLQSDLDEPDPEDTVVTLSKPVPIIDPLAELNDVDRVFKSRPDLSSLPVVSSGEPLGIVRRRDLLELFSTQFGRALHEQKTVTHLLKKDALIVESTVSLSKVSYQLINQNSDNLNNEIIIVRQGRYHGMGSLRDLLKRITELKIQNATYSNPLTLLPGNVPINKEVDRRLKLAQDFYVAYFDLNEFKPFNDYYGYAKGDRVIRLLGLIIKRYAEQAENFIGHIGGDDFVVIFGQSDFNKACEQILKDFSDEVKALYSVGELEAGGILTEDRSRNRKLHSILSLAIGIVHPDSALCRSHHEVAELAALAKKEAKAMGGNAVFKSRRRFLPQPSVD